MKFVIGDIHGEVTKLRRLIHNIERYPIDRLIFIGDCLDKGENSKEVLKFLHKLSGKYQCDFVLRDHEYTWLKFINFGEYREFISIYGGKVTADNFGISELSPQQAYKKLYLPFKDFFDRLKKFVITDNYIISHSGINPIFADSRDLEQLDEKEFIFQRNSFIEMKRLVGGKRFIFGHTAFADPWYDGYKVAIDTGAVYSKTAPLTAFEIKKEFFIDSSGLRRNLVDFDISVRPDIIHKDEGIKDNE